MPTFKNSLKCVFSCTFGFGEQMNQITGFLDGEYLRWLCCTQLQCAAVCCSLVTVVCCRQQRVRFWRGGWGGTQGLQRRTAQVENLLSSEMRSANVGHFAGPTNQTRTRTGRWQRTCKRCLTIFGMESMPLEEYLYLLLMIISCFNNLCYIEVDMRTI